MHKFTSNQSKKYTKTETKSAVKHCMPKEFGVKKSTKTETKSAEKYGMTKDFGCFTHTL